MPSRSMPWVYDPPEDLIDIAGVLARIRPQGSYTLLIRSPRYHWWSERLSDLAIELQRYCMRPLHVQLEFDTEESLTWRLTSERLENPGRY